MRDEGPTDARTAHPAGPVPVSRLATALSSRQAVRHVGPDASVTDVHHDSRMVRPSSLFVAIRGAVRDGHDHVPDAIAAGATAIAVEVEQDTRVAQLVVEDTRRALPALADEVHRHPSNALTVVGITGTNGKTTVTHMLKAIADAGDGAAAVVGTVGTTIAGDEIPLARTTPESSDLQRLLRRMVDTGVALAAIEVSSHALAYGRVDDVQFAVAAFTNLSQDHLDFHGTMEDYFRTKAKLFEPDRTKQAVIWVDDEWGGRLAQECDLPVTTVGFDASAEISVQDVELSLTGSRFEVVNKDGVFCVALPIAGAFNVANALVAAACARAVGIGWDAIVLGLAAIPPISGRFETVDEGQNFAVIVDYAHTPDAIQAVIAQVRPLAGGRIIVVAGAGGDRDAAKRPMMGQAAATADAAVLTTDNPRSEDPEEILAAVAAGADRCTSGSVVTEVDRRAAIRYAVRLAEKQDVVLILGKGHETHQELAGGVMVSFDDRLVAAEEIRAWGASQ